MDKKSPNVIFKSKYLLALNNNSNRLKTNSYSQNREKDIGEMFEYFSDNKKRVVGMFEYYMGHTRGEDVNLVMDNGKYATREDIKRLKISYKKYIHNSNLWKGIISFNPEYLDKNISFRDLEQKFAKEIMPKFLKYCGFKDIKNMSYVFSIHNNTKHPHIHFAFVEKKPNFKCSNGKVSYRAKGKISIDEQRYLKRMVELAIENEKRYKPLLIDTNKDIDYLKSYFNPNDKNFALKNINDFYIEEKIIKLGTLINDYRNSNNQSSKRVKFNSIKSNEIKKLTKEIKNNLFSNENSLLYSSKKKVNEDLEKLNKYFEELDKSNNIEGIINDNSIVSKKEDYINNYIYNSIINHALYKYNHLSNTIKDKRKKDKITIEDLIQEISSNVNSEYTNEYKVRKDILHNYFNNSNKLLKFPNKYRIESAIKNINYEMDQASQEFSKLFNYNSKNM